MLDISVFKYIFLIVYVFSSCAGMHVMKKSKAINSIGFVSGLVVFGASSVFWLICIRIFPLAETFPIVTGFLTIGTMITGRLMLNEEFGYKRIIAVLLIIIGIILVGNKS